MNRCSAIGRVRWSFSLKAALAGCRVRRSISLVIGRKEIVPLPPSNCISPPPQQKVLAKVHQAGADEIHAAVWRPAKPGGTVQLEFGGPRAVFLKTRTCWQDRGVRS